MTTANKLTADAIDIARRQNLETLTLEGLFAAGNVQVVRNRYTDAQSLFERALGIAEDTRHEEYKARAWLSLATVFVRVMEPDKAENAVVRPDLITSVSGKRAISPTLTPCWARFG